VDQVEAGAVGEAVQEAAQEAEDPEWTLAQRIAAMP